MPDVRAPDYNDRRDEAPARPPADPRGGITPVLEPNEARQGATHHNVRYVLAVSLAAAFIAMAVAYFFFFPTIEPMDTLPPSDASSAPAQPASPQP